MNERKFQREVVQTFEGLGCFTFNVHGHSMQKAGIPDLFVSHPTWCGWLELKVGEGKASAIQRKQILELRRTSSSAWILRWKDGICTIEDLERVIQAEVGSESNKRSINKSNSWHSIPIPIP